MINVTKPIAPAHAAPIPSLKIRSSMSETITAPQPMKIAEEYRLVTGGRSWRYIRETRAERVNRKREQQNVKCRTVERPAPPEPRCARQ